MNTMKVEITNSNNQIQVEELNRLKTSQNKDKHPETTYTAQNDAKPNKTTNHNQTPSQNYNMPQQTKKNTKASKIIGKQLF